jgi:hypothetical protein
MKIIFDVFEMEKLLRHNLGLIFVLNGYSKKSFCELFNISDIVFNFSNDDILELVLKGQL